MKQGNTSTFSPVSFAVKIALILFVFGIFPIFVTIVAVNYRNQARVIVEAPNRLREQAMIEEMIGDETGGASILTREQAETMRDVRLYIVGRWVSLQDKNYSVDILPNNTFKDKDGDIIVAYGIWNSHVSSTSSSNIKFDSAQDFSANSVSNKTDSYYLTKTHLEPNHKDEKFSYEIMQLDQDRAILYYTGNGKVLYFVRDNGRRATSTSATSSPVSVEVKKDI